MADTAERYGWSINEWAAATSLSRARVYEILPDLDSVKHGTRRIILTHPRDWLNSLREADAATVQSPARQSDQEWG